MNEFYNLDIKPVNPIDVSLFIPVPQLDLSSFSLPKLNIPLLTTTNKTSTMKDVGSTAVKAATLFASDKFSNEIFGNDTELGRNLGTIFSQGLSAAGNRIGSNILKGESLSYGLGRDVGVSVAGTAAGITGNYIGQGINSLGGNSMLSRGIGQGVATGIGSVGGTMLSNVFAGKSLLNGLSGTSTGIDILRKTGTLKSGEALKVQKLANANLAGIGMSVVGSGLQAAFGPSKEYGGKYGGITKTMDTAYDLVQGAAGFVPGYGTLISGAMALNKGLSNIFGSTSGMTVQDAILGSAFMPAPVKWLNMAGASTTGSFNNLSWLNSERVNSFMGNAFGNLGDRFDLAREEAGKTYGTFSQGAESKALNNINFSNYAWDRVMAMANLNELLNIRSLYMSSINNQRYALDIGGAWLPIYRGKQGMKIFNDTINHNIGQRLLSGAALVDNKQMILSAQSGTKVTRQRPRPLPRKPATREENPELWDEWERRELELLTAKLRVYDLEQESANKRAETNTKHALHYSNLATGIAETTQQNVQFEPVTLESLQNSNTELLKQELLADKNEYFDNGMKVIEAAGFADLGFNVAYPLLKRGFRWAFDKAGNLIKVPVKETELFPRGLTSNEPLIAAGTPKTIRLLELKITPENAASITPEQWTAAQDAAIARGDMAEAQRLRDLHFKVSAPNTEITDIQYHGSPYTFNVFDPAKRGNRDQGWFGKGYYFTPSKDYAAMYGETRPFYINAEDVYTKGVGNIWFGKESSPQAKLWLKMQDKRGKGLEAETILDDLRFSDAVRDAMPQTKPYNGIFEEVVTRNNNQMKLADAVTYDDNGVRIPLGKRDNFSKNDIRYSWLPWFLGGSTAATLYNKTK